MRPSVQLERRMITTQRTITFLAILAILMPAFVLLAGGAAKVSDLAGQWHGTNRFTGISYEEATQKKVSPRELKVALQISTDGKVTGRLGGAELRDCVVESNRGWLGRKLNIKTDFVIRGHIVGAVATGSAGGTNTISAPFNLVAGQIKGTVFAMHPFTYPYPFFGFRLNREP